MRARALGGDPLGRNSTNNGHKSRNAALNKAEGLRTATLPCRGSRDALGMIPTRYPSGVMPAGHGLGFKILDVLSNILAASGFAAAAPSPALSAA